MFNYDNFFLIGNGLEFNFENVEKKFISDNMK